MEELAEVPQESGADVVVESQPTEEQATETIAEAFDGDESSPEVKIDGEEIEYDGEKFIVPKQLKDAFLRQQDYTQKTQSVAEQRKQVELQAQEIKRAAEQHQAFIAEYAEAYALDNQLKQYASIDWAGLIESDPVQAMKLDRQMRDLQSRRDSVVASVSQKQQQQTMELQRETAKRIQDGRAVLEREIKEWSPELGKKLMSYGKEIGFTDAELSNVTNPNVVKLLYKSWKFDQLIEKQASSKSQPSPQEKPVTRISASKGTAVKDPAKMTDSEFAKWRRSQIAQR